MIFFFLLLTRERVPHTLLKGHLNAVSKSVYTSRRQGKKLERTRMKMQFHFLAFLVSQALIVTASKDLGESSSREYYENGVPQSKRSDEENQPTARFWNLGTLHFSPMDLCPCLNDCITKNSSKGRSHGNLRNHKCPSCISQARGNLGESVPPDTKEPASMAGVVRVVEEVLNKKGTKACSCIHELSNVERNLVHSIA